MHYTSISTILHDPKTAPAAFEYAIAAARHWDAHLHVVCAGIDKTDPGFYYGGGQAIALQSNFENAQDVAIKLQGLVEQRLETDNIAWDVETVSLMMTGIEPYLSKHMRFSDLVVLPLPYAKASSHIDVRGFESCLFGSDIPIMVIPDTAIWTAPPQRILLAWDDGAEALAAARAALPLITAADQTEICVVDPPKHGNDRCDPGGRLAQMLARAGANVEITVLARLRSDIATQLLQRATETGAQMIVMGGYGHSRLREATLGGVTRTMLRDATVPVLMAR